LNSNDVYTIENYGINSINKSFSLQVNVSDAYAVSMVGNRNNIHKDSSMQYIVNKDRIPKFLGDDHNQNKGIE